MITVEHHPAISTALLRLLVSGRLLLHHYDEPVRRRIMIAEAVAEVPLDGAIILTETTSDREQEPARSYSPSYSPSCCPACNTQKRSITS